VRALVSRGDTIVAGSSQFNLAYGVRPEPPSPIPLPRLSLRRLEHITIYASRIRGVESQKRTIRSE